MITTLTREGIIEAISHVMDPELGLNLVDLGMVRDVKVEGGAVRLTLAVITMICPLLKVQMADAARAAVAALPGVKDVEVETVEMTEEERFRILSRMFTAAAV